MNLFLFFGTFLFSLLSAFLDTVLPLCSFFFFSESHLHEGNIYVINFPDVIQSSGMSKKMDKFLSNLVNKVWLCLPAKQAWVWCTNQVPIKWTKGMWIAHDLENAPSVTQLAKIEKDLVVSIFVFTTLQLMLFSQRGSRNRLRSSAMNRGKVKSRDLNRSLFIQAQLLMAGSWKEVSNAETFSSSAVLAFVKNATAYSWNWLTIAGVTRPGRRMGAALWFSWNLTVAVSIVVDCAVVIIQKMLEELLENEEEEERCDEVGEGDKWGGEGDGTVGGGTSVDNSGSNLHMWWEKWEASITGHWREAVNR